MKNPSKSLRNAVKQGFLILLPLAIVAVLVSMAIEFVLRNPNVSSAIVGGLNLDHIRENVRAAGATTWSKAEGST